VLPFGSGIGEDETGVKERLKRAYESGKVLRAKGRLRVSPFYEEREIVNGRKIDVTDQLDRYFFAGFDGQPMPELASVAASGK